MRNVVGAVSAGLLSMLMLPSAAWGQSGEEIRVEVSPHRIEATLGDSFDVEVTVTNGSDRPTAPLVAHIDITDPAQSTSVDPEDWTETLSQTIGVVPPGGTQSVSWTLQPISPGSFSLYAVALSGETDLVQASAATFIEVAFVQTLNPEGVLPVVLAGPILIGALWMMAVRRSRNQGPGSPG